MSTQPRARFVHPEDEPFVEAGPPGPTQLQLHVLPLPVNGNLRTADVVLLMLNPNYSDQSDKAWRLANPDASQRLTARQVANLGQVGLTSGDQAFYDVAPEFSTYPGAAYWRGTGKLGDIARGLASALGCTLGRAFEEIAKRVAVLQLVPYRSIEFDRKDLIKHAPSSAQAIALARYLADDTDKLIVATRQISNWGFEFPSARPNVIVYDPTTEARRASMSLRSRGGPAILERLLGKATPRSVARAVPTQRESSVQPAPVGAPARPSAAIPVHAPALPSSPAAFASSAVDVVNRTAELVHLYESSGLSALLESAGLVPPGKAKFSKLKFRANDFRVSSLERYDLKSGESYLRVHYLPGAPEWLVSTLATWPGFRGANGTGANFTLGDPMAYTVALTKLLTAHR